VDSNARQLSKILKNRVEVRVWQGAVLVDIRMMFLDNGKWAPFPQGISLDEKQWSLFLGHLEAVKKALNVDG